MNGKSEHKVTLDWVISTMRQTGRDMLTRYKETISRGPYRQRRKNAERLISI
jgi:L-serine deaminase